MPHMLALLMFLGLVMYIYAIVGMELFSGNYPNGALPAEPLAWAGYTDLYAYANFESFGNAMLLLFQLVSTSNWHELYLTGRTTLHEQMGGTGPNLPPSARCASPPAHREQHHHVVS